MMDELIQCSTTFAGMLEAERCAQKLVEDRLAACVQISSPILSVYRWEGKIHRESEVLLTIKSVGYLSDRLIEAIGRLHSYQQPEIVIVPITRVSEGYGRWLREQVLPPT
jgi:periplasmic divalent cation tolerance protein